MNLRTFGNDDVILWEALMLSLGLHVLLLHAGQFTLQFKRRHTVEIDITNMGRMGVSVPKRAAAPTPPKPVAKPQEWIQPRPDQKVAPAPIPTQPVPAPPPEEPPPPPEYDIGNGGNSAAALSRIPQLLNLSDLRAILQRFYPEQARSERRQGAVVLDLHIDTDGHVQAVDVVQSGGSDFDAAAKRAAMLLRFMPAFLGSQRVAVKMRQAIQFKLEE
jgi:TonB family protein